MGLLTHLQRLRRENKGAALVEFTLVAPLLIGLMCGLAEFGLLLRQYHIMEKGVRDAARYLASVPVHPTCMGFTDAGTYTWANAITDAKSLAIYGSTGGTTPLYADWSDSATVTVDDGTCVASLRANGVPLGQLTVTASAPYQDLGLLSVLGIGPFTLTVSHQELKAT